MRVLNDLPRSQHRDVILGSERAVGTQSGRLDVRLRQGCKVRNHSRDVLDPEGCEIGPMLSTRERAAQRKFGFRESPDMRRRLETKNTELVVEIGALERVSCVVNRGFTMPLATTAPAGHLELCAGGGDFRGVRRGGDTKFLQ